ncbi:MICAL-like protein 2 [Heptranchias perlo]|uniref:MICAL-like protein 2 n=1 Tax=Heptranchias perlo TaxID=212740 RepID=UPI00355A38C4
MAAIKALQQWCKRQCEGYPNVEVTNMTTSWRDGLAFCAVLHHFRPDLIDFDSLKKEDIYENNNLAFRVAEEELGIPALLDAEDMVALKVPDRLSILTYLSQYHNYFTGRSPIGGLAHIKRPASESNEEPVQKRSTPEAKPKLPKNTPTPRVAPVNKVPGHGAGERSNKSGTLTNNCAICKEKVLLVQRYLVDGKLYHRNCFRCKQCLNTLVVGAYKTGSVPGTFICINHQNKAGENDNNNSSSSLISPSSQGHGPKPSEPAPTVHGPVVGHGTSSAAVTRAPRQAEASPAAFKAGGSSAEKTQAAKQKFMSSGAPLGKGASPHSGSPTISLQSPDPVRGWQSPMETTTPGYRSPGNQERGNVPLKSPSTPTTSSDTDKDKARLVLLKNLPFDSNNNRSQGVASPSQFITDQPPQSTSHQSAKTITLDVVTQRSDQPRASQSATPEQRAKPANAQAKDSKWRPNSASEASPRPVVTRGVANAELVLTPSTERAPCARLNRASSMKEATGHGLSPDQANSKGNFSYSPQIITGAEANESPSDWRSKLKPVQKHHSLGPSDFRKVHSSSINVDIKKPEAYGKTAVTPSTSKTAGGSNWTPSTTQWNTSTGSGKHVEVTFSLHNPGNATISTSPATPSKEVSGTEAKTSHSNQKKILKPGVDLLAGVKNGFQSPNGTDKDPSEKDKWSSRNPALSMVEEELPGRQSWVLGKPSTVTVKTAREKFFEDVYIPGDPKKTQGLTDSTTPQAKTPSSHRITEEEIQRELRDIGKELDALEQKGVELEPQLRSCEGDDREDELMVEWFKLIHEKQLLIRRESELVYMSKQQILVDRQSRIDQELRVLMGKSEDEKTDGDRAREEELMEELLKTVTDRDNIIDRLDEDRVREREEDLMMEAMINRIDISKETEQDLKKKNKFSPLKFLKGLGGKPKGKE